MGHDRLVQGRSHLVDALDLAWAAGIQDVGLQDVRVAEQDQVMEPPAERVLLAGGDRDVQGIADLLQAGQVVVRDGLFEVVDAERFEASALLNSRGHRIAVVGVEAEILAAREEFARCLEELVVLLGVDVLAPTPPVHTDLEGAEASFPTVLDQGQHLFGLHPPAGTRAPVEGNRGSPGAPHEGVDRQPGVLSEQVPQGYVDDADHPAGQFVEPLVPTQCKGLPMAVDKPRIFAHQGGFDGPGQVAVEDRIVAARDFRPSLDLGVGLDS